MKAFRPLSQTLGIPLKDLTKNKPKVSNDFMDKATKMSHDFFTASKTQTNSSGKYPNFSKSLNPRALKSELIEQCKQIATKLPKLLDYKDGQIPPERQLPMPSPLITGAVLIRK
jgi:hypothetical protein